VLLVPLLAILLCTYLLALVVRHRTATWALAVAATVAMVGAVVPAGVSRQQIALVSGLVLGDALTAWVLAVLAIHLLSAGPQNWGPKVSLMGLGIVVTALGGHMLVTASGVALVLAVHLIVSWPWTSQIWRSGAYLVGAAAMAGGLYAHLASQSGWFLQPSPGPIRTESWLLIFVASWALLRLFPFSLLEARWDQPGGALLRVAVAMLMLRTLNFGPWPPYTALLASVAVGVALVVEVLRSGDAWHHGLPSYYLLALLPVAGPLGPAAAMASEFVYPLWPNRPGPRGAGGTLLSVAWIMSSIVPLWLAVATLHQAGLTVYGGLALVAGLVALRRVPEAGGVWPGLAIPLLPPLLFPLAWQYLVSPAVDALYQGLAPMFVVADPWAGIFFPSGDLVLTLLPFPTLSLAVPALLAVHIVVARYIGALERSS
jgi:hypothetical protein